MPKVTGVAFDAAKAPLSGATVEVFRTSTRAFIGSAVADAQGNYSVTVPDTSADYFALAFKAGPPYLTGMTRRNLAGVADTTEEMPVGDGTNLRNLWTGVPTSDGALVAARMNTTKTANLARLVVSESPDLSNPVEMPIVAPDQTYRIAKLRASGLQPNKEYHYAVRVDGVLDALRGRFRTLPPAGAPASFRLAFGCCANNSIGSAAGYPAHQAIRELLPRPLAFIFLGDLTYSNNGTTNEADKLPTYDGAMSIATRGQTMREVPTVYMWDDHDFGPDNSAGYSTDGTVRTYRQAAIDAYRRRVPAPVQSTDPTHTVDYAFVVGRVKIIMSDLRADKWDSYTAASNTSKTMMGAAQKQRWKDHIASAAAAGQYVVWVSSVPWHSGTNNVNTDWGGYNRERVELADHIKACGMGGRVTVICGDGHSQAYHIGVDYATGGGALTPVFQVGAMHSSYSEKGGPYTVGPIVQASTSNYAVMDLYDDGANLTIQMVGKAAADDSVLFSYRYTPLGVDQGAGAITPPGDTTAPVLSAPTATATGDTSAAINVTTDTGEGVLFDLVTTNSTATAAQVKAGTQQTITGAGQKTFSRTALAAATQYYAHMLQRDLANNESPVVSTAAFMTQAAAVETGFSATGGPITDLGNGMREMVISADTDLVVTRAGQVQYYLQGAGGAGSSGNSSSAGAGAGGEPLVGTQFFEVGTYAGRIGKGGVGTAGARGTAGGNTTLGSLTALGGGSGAVSGTAGIAGVNGGGGAANSSGVTPPGQGTAGKGFNGGAGFSSAGSNDMASGGGAGAGGPGGDASFGKAGDGGPGIEVFGRRVAGGGGGACGTVNGVGQDGGGKGGNSSTNEPTNGVAGTGAGGGGARGNRKPGNGADGQIILRWSVNG